MNKCVFFFIVIKIVHVSSKAHLVDFDVISSAHVLTLQDGYDERT